MTRVGAENRALMLPACIRGKSIAAIERAIPRMVATFPGSANEDKSAIKAQQ